MFLSAVVRLKCVSGGRMPYTSGQCAHAWLLHAVEKLYPDVSATLHGLQNDAVPPPFTISELRKPSGGPAGPSVSEGEYCDLRVTAIAHGLDGVFSEAIRTCVDDVRIGPAHFVIESVTARPDVHPRASHVSPEDIVAQWLAGPPPPNRVVLAFESATAFRSRKKNVLFPLPELVFGSLHRRWEQSDLDLPLIDRPAVERLCAGAFVSEYELRTVIYHFKDFPHQKGFLGRCVYVIPKDDVDAARAAHLLADFAYYAGVGYKVAMGMGSIAPPLHHEKQYRR